MSALINMSECLKVLDFCLQKIKVRDDILESENYQYLFTVEAVNIYVKEGLPFRDAYMKVAEEIKSGKFERPENLTHTHEGSKDNLFNHKIKFMMEKVIGDFNFEKVEKALQDLRKI